MHPKRPNMLSLEPIMLQCEQFEYVILDILHGLTYEILGIKPLLIDKPSGILNLKDKAPLILLQEGCSIRQG